MARGRHGRRGMRTRTANMGPKIRPSSSTKVEALPRAIPMSAVTTPLLLRRTAAVPGTGLAVSFATVVARSFLDLEIFFSDCDICDPVSRPAAWAPPVSGCSPRDINRRLLHVAPPPRETPAMARPISPDLAGMQLQPVTASWNEKDVMLYALGVGARPPEDLDFLYEGLGPVVLPTYGVIPGLMAMGGVFGEDRKSTRLNSSH